MGSDRYEADVLEFDESGLAIHWIPVRKTRSCAPFIHPSQLRKLRGQQQVAAVCYRVSRIGIEFLLVKTRGRRWTFPKGSMEPGLTHAQAAALEAFEEAGVHGRMEEIPFARYLHRKKGEARRSGHAELLVYAHLCEVARLEQPKERKRRPTWFSLEQTKRRLRADRARDAANELLQLVDRAAARIARLHRAIDATALASQRDALQAAPFEACEIFETDAGATEPAYSRYSRGKSPGVRRATSLEVARSPVLGMGEILQLTSGRENEQQLSLPAKTRRRCAPR